MEGLCATFVDEIQLLAILLEWHEGPGILVENKVVHHLRDVDGVSGNKNNQFSSGNNRSAQSSPLSVFLILSAMNMTVTQLPFAYRATPPTRRTFISSQCQNTPNRRQ